MNTYIGKYDTRGKYDTLVSLVSGNTPDDLVTFVKKHSEMGWKLDRFYRRDWGWWVQSRRRCDDL